jgi:hypothetical protein
MAIAQLTRVRLTRTALAIVVGLPMASAATPALAVSGGTKAPKQTIVATNAMAGHRVGCHVTARNAGGRFTDSSPRVGDLLIGR